MEYIKPSKEEKSYWHIWFAWYPVVVWTYPDGARKKIWLQNVLRCRKKYSGYDYILSGIVVENEDHYYVHKELN